MQPLFPGFLGPSIHSLKKPPKPYPLSYLSITHAGCSNEGLLDGVALLKHPLLLARHCPVTLNQKLDNLQMTSECSVDQGTLPILIQVIHLREGTEKPMWKRLRLYSQSGHISPLHRSGLLRFILSYSLDQSLRKFRRYSPTQARSSLSYNSGRCPSGENLFA